MTQQEWLNNIENKTNLLFNEINIIKNNYNRINQDLSTVKNNINSLKELGPKLDKLIINIENKFKNPFADENSNLNNDKNPFIIQSKKYILEMINYQKV